jgi:predicted homoserine dehydrogenase-like protein
MQAANLDAALRDGSTHVGDDWQALVRHPAVDVVVESTGAPVAAVDHCLEAFAHGKAVVNVTVEADALCGALLARRAAEAGVVYSLAFGDQPALICDLVDWARTCGFPVVAAGRGHKWRPQFCESTPETVWAHYGLTPEQAERGGLNPKMFNSFLDGSKPAIESAAVANATGLEVPSDGLQYPSAAVDQIPNVTRPRAAGGVLERAGMVEVINSLDAEGRPIDYDIRMGVWVTVEGETPYVRHCFEEYNARTDDSGRYFTLYKRWHLIGLEVGHSVASVVLRGEPTGVARGWKADVVATAKRDLAAGERLDGEGGRTVWGKLLPARTSRTIGGLPLGLAHGVPLLRPVRKGQSLVWDDVAIDRSTRAWRLRREMEAAFATAG